MTKIAPCVWYDGTAEDAATFYAATFPDSSVDAVHRPPTDDLSGKEGDVLTVEFTVCGMPFLALNGGPMFPQTEAVSFQTMEAMMTMRRIDIAAIEAAVAGA